MPDSVIYATIVAVVLLVCRYWRRDPASPGPDSEELSGVRPGENPPKCPGCGDCVPGAPYPTPHPLDTFAEGLTTRLECPPGHDRASDLLSDNNLVTSGLSTGGVVRSTAAGAPAVHIYRWVRPAEGKKMLERNWWLEHVDPRYGTWLVMKEERWP